MSSDDDDMDAELSRGGEGARRRKMPRACDVCRRKKIRCDAVSELGSQCSYCTNLKLDCTFNVGTVKRGPPKGYINDLERRCEALERLIIRLAPDINLENEIGPSFDRETWATVMGKTGRGSRWYTQLTTSTNPGRARPYPEPPKNTQPLRGILPTLIPTNPEPDVTTNLDSDDERNFPDGEGGLSKHNLESRLEKMSITGFEKRFHGKSSSLTLVQVAMSLKRELEGPTPLTVQPFKGPFKRRIHFWRPCPWEWVTNHHSAAEALASLEFPPDDLGSSLVQLCFEKLMIQFPIVHGPTFEEQRKSGLHHRQLDFARVYLLMCAIGARFSDDPRATLKNPEGGLEWRSSGWKFFSQAMAVERPILATAGLVDLQIAGLAALYLHGTSVPSAGWLTAGIGLRFAQDIGAHREKVYGHDRPFENQMWKRAFWSLVVIDRLLSGVTGRPMAVFDEDTDVDLPLEVDDEYYDEVKKEWKQPAGKPSYLTAFNQLVKLTGILGYAIRTIYSIHKSRAHLGFVGPEWEAQTVAQLDSALNSWSDHLPEHLRWDPSIQDPQVFKPASALRLIFHYVQIAIHRPFIPLRLPGTKVSPLSSPSLAICTTAARSASRILEARIKAEPDTLPLSYVLAFTSGIVLLIGLWGAKKDGVNTDLQEADVRRCLNALQQIEQRCFTAGRLFDVLTELATLHDVPTSQASSTTSEPSDTRTGEKHELLPEPRSCHPHEQEPRVPFIAPPMIPQTTPGQGAGTVNERLNAWPAQDTASGWGNWQLASGDILGMNPGLSSHPSGLGVFGTFNGTPDVMFPNTLFQELLGGFNEPMGANATSTQLVDDGFGVPEGNTSQGDFDWTASMDMSGMMPHYAPPK